MTSSGARRNVGTKLQLRPSELPVRFEKPRLNRADYVGAFTYHITLTTATRSWFLDEGWVAQRAGALLTESAEKHGFILLAYCFMPDHVQVLLRGQTKDSDLLRFVQRFKQRTGFEFKDYASGKFWQQRFHDRKLRHDEDPAVVAEYIFENPERANLPTGSRAHRVLGGAYWPRRRATDGAKASSLHDSSPESGASSPDKVKA